MKLLQLAGGQFSELVVPDQGVLARELPFGGNAAADLVHAADYGGRAMLEFDAADTVGMSSPYALMPAEFSTRSRSYIAQAASLTPLNYGFPTAVLVAGAGAAATARTPTTTDLFSGSTRFALPTATTTGSMAAWRGMSLSFYQGDTVARGGGWFFAARFGFSAITAGARVFAGMSATATITNVEPTTLVNSVGIGCNAADANLYIIAAGAAAGGAKVDTGLPKNATNVWLDVIFSAPCAAGKVGYAFKRGGYGTTWTRGTLTTGIPVANTMLSPSVFSTNGTTAAALTLEFEHAYTETDF